MREEWRTLHGIAHESGPNVREKEISTQILYLVSTLTFFLKYSSRQEAHQSFSEFYISGPFLTGSTPESVSHTDRVKEIHF